MEYSTKSFKIIHWDCTPITKSREVKINQGCDIQYSFKFPTEKDGIDIYLLNLRWIFRLINQEDKTDIILSYIAEDESIMVLNEVKDEIPKAKALFLDSQSRFIEGFNRNKIGTPIQGAIFVPLPQEKLGAIAEKIITEFLYKAR